MSPALRNLEQVVAWRLCIGCGTCAAACPQGGVQLQDLPDEGIRPRFAAGTGCRERLSVCPGATVEAPAAPEDEAGRELGAILEIWEGYAVDPEIRFQASSGGLLTALSLFCLQEADMEFVLQAGMDPQQPWRNATHASRGRADLLAHTGSRYATSSPCEGLPWIEHSEGQCLLVAKPCDVAGAALLRRENPALDRRIGLVLTFFCAGTPSTRGTLDLLRELGVDPGELSGLRYRGLGWPGGFRPALRDGGSRFLGYQESWGRLTAYRPLRCHLCPDGLGRLADISCGDAWHRHGGPGDSDPGRSLVLVRTPLGRRILAEAAAAGYVRLEPSGAPEVLRAQADLLQRRRQLHGRLLAFRLLGLPVPRYRGFALRSSWRRLPAGERFRVVAGTLRRILRRGWWRPWRPWG